MADFGVLGILSMLGILGILRIWLTMDIVKLKHSLTIINIKLLSNLLLQILNLILKFLPRLQFPLELTLPNLHIFEQLFVSLLLILISAPLLQILLVLVVIFRGSDTLLHLRIEENVVTWHLNIVVADGILVNVLDTAAGKLAFLKLLRILCGWLTVEA